MKKRGIVNAEMKTLISEPLRARIVLVRADIKNLAALKKMK